MKLSWQPSFSTPSENLLFENREDFLFPKNEVLLVVDLDLGAGILADENPVALLHIERKLLAVFVDLAFAHGHHLRLHRLFLGRVGDDDSAFLGFLGFQSLDENAVVK